MGKRKAYLEDIPLAEAVRRLWTALEATDALAPMSGEWVPLDEARGRVTAAPVWAKLSAPHYHGAAMDGVAVRAADTRGATEATPVRLKVGPDTRWVDTGDPLPEGFDAVIMLEHLQELGPELLEIVAPVAPWQHVRSMGEDMVAGELVAPENHLLRPVDVGAVAACGHTGVFVRRKPRVAILPTGTELIRPGEPVEPGRIIEFNSLMLAGQVEEWGGQPIRYPITPDIFDQIRGALKRAVDEADIVLMNAGSSAGSEDFTAAAVAELGTLLVHGVAVRPGHPVIMGVVGGKPVIGVPGYPVSAVLTAEIFVRDLVCRRLGLPAPPPRTLKAWMTRKVLSPMGDDEYLRVKVGQVGDQVVATPLSRGAGAIMSLVRADGIVVIPRFNEGVHAGEEVTVQLWRSPEAVTGTIVAIGSHDLTLDVLADLLRRDHPDRSLASSNVGSLGGLLALQRGEAHLAGSHLLDEETGEYNVSYIRRHLPGRPVVLLRLVGRQQGLIVPPGNPKGIRDLGDLARGDVRFVNRQRGAGTRVLLDFQLKRLGITPGQVPGYEREEFTHLNVAAAVASGRADVGLGILAAARALNLEFLPLLVEPYDLVIPREFWSAPLLEPLLEAIRSDAFKRTVAELGGYETTATGTVVAEI